MPPQRVSSPVTPTSAPPTRVDAIAVRGHSSTALDVEQDVVDGITDLTGEQAERVDLRVVDGSRGTPGSCCCPRSRPSCPGFEAEHATCQPASDSRPGHRPCRRSRHGEPSAPTTNGDNRIPGVAARTPTAVRTDVETGPVIHSSDHRGRLGVRTRSEIRSNSRRSRAERDQTGRNKQNLLHSFYSRSVLDSPQGRGMLIASFVRITVTSRPQPTRNSRSVNVS